MDLGLAGRTALVTGADSGIGWHTAAYLLREGARVVVSDIDQAGLDDAAEDLPAQEGQLTAVAADITDPESVHRLRDQVDALGGGLDIVVHSAGTSGAAGEFESISDEEWEHTLQIDLLGAVRIARAFLPALRASGRGRLIFLTSENAVQPYASELPYDAAKAGVLALAKGMSRSYGADGLLINCVSPAFIQTPMTDEMMAQRSAELGVSVDEAIATFLDEERPHMVLKRRGRPDEVAAVIAFLCSDQASFVNGSDYRVDAGSVATIN